MKSLTGLTSKLEQLTEKAKREALDDTETAERGDERRTDVLSADNGLVNGDGSNESEASDEASSGATEEHAEDPGDPNPTENGEWRVADTPLEETLHGVVQTTNGVYAVGTGGVVAHRTGDGSWTVPVPSGPAAKRNTLTCVAVTDDRERLWFAGSSGALGMYDTTAGQKYDYSAPMEMTSTWEGISVSGSHGDETLYVANGSGEVLTAAIDENDCLTLGETVKPGSGSTVPALDVGPEAVYAVNTSGNVFARPGDEWTTIGIRNAQINFTDVNAGPDRQVLVTGGGGIVYRYDARCENWTPIAVGTVVLRGIDRDDDRVAVVGDNGRIYVRRPRDSWVRQESPTESTLHDVALGPTDVAVGEGGVIVERSAAPPDDQPSDPTVEP